MTKVYIAGCAIESINRHYDKGLLDLAINSVKRINENINYSLNPDAIVIANGYAELTNRVSELSTKLSMALGYYVPSFRVENGDASGGLGILTAFSLIKSGIAKEVLLIGVEKLSDFPSKYLNDIISTIMNEYEYFSGITPQSIAAIMMKLYMKLYKKDYEYFTEWPILMHSYAIENPYAYLKFTVDKKTIIESQLVSEPLRIFDVGARADGVASVLLVSEERKQISDRIV
ncbi:MAG: thiolase family protein, partial [Sulfolobaceae archaeon]